MIFCCGARAHEFSGLCFCGHGHTARDHRQQGDRGILLHSPLGAHRTHRGQSASSHAAASGPALCGSPRGLGLVVSAHRGDPPRAKRACGRSSLSWRNWLGPVLDASGFVKRSQVFAGNAVEARGDAHLFLPVLACQCVQIIRTQLADRGIHDSCDRLRKILQVQRRVTSSFKTREGRTLNVGKASLPELLAHIRRIPRNSDRLWSRMCMPAHRPGVR